MADETASAGKREWNYHPALPIDNNPLFAWPPRLKDAAIYYRDGWLLAGEGAFLVIASLVAFAFFTPSLDDAATLEWQWALMIYARNIAAMLLLAGGLHYYFYTIRGQKTELKYVEKFLSKDSGRFSFRDQVHDNMFFSLVSGVGIWTVYEIIMFRALGGGGIRAITFAEMPIWTILAFPLITMWISFHFYCGHRLLHTRWLYDKVHALHHRNVNIGPWSGISMHPVEHVIYFSSVLIHFILPTHPVHIIFHMYALSLSAVIGHTGFDALLITNKRRVQVGHFHHQLHHRYFECNYGSVDMPWDLFFGTFHDGTDAARKRMMRRQGLRQQTREPQ